MIERVVIDVDGREGRALQDAIPIQHRSTLCDTSPAAATGATCSGTRTASKLAFVSTSRDHKQATLRVADAATGDVRDVLEEKVDTFFESGNGARELALPAGIERGDLVLASATTGASSISTTCRPAR